MILWQSITTSRFIYLAMVCSEYYSQYIRRPRIYTNSMNKNSSSTMQFLDISQYIPALYWTSKEHKRPYEFRLIAEAYIKQLSIEPLLILICIKNNFMNYCKVRPNKTDISNSWSVDNSYEFINKISDTNTARNIKTFRLFRSLHRFITGCYSW